MRNALNYRESVAVWIARELGWKIRDIHSRYDVDPRRLYEVWTEETHIGSRDDAIRLFRILFPDLDGYFDPHSPKYKRSPRDQLDLF